MRSWTVHLFGPKMVIFRVFAQRFNEGRPNTVFCSMVIPNPGLMVKFGAKLAFLQVNGAFWGEERGYWGLVWVQKGSLSAFSHYVFNEGRPNTVFL